MKKIHNAKYWNFSKLPLDLGQITDMIRVNVFFRLSLFYNKTNHLEIDSSKI
jgi:hypothetical protein